MARARSEKANKTFLPSSQMSFHFLTFSLFCDCVRKKKSVCFSLNGNTGFIFNLKSTLSFSWWDFRHFSIALIHSLSYLSGWMQREKRSHSRWQRRRRRKFLPSKHKFLFFLDSFMAFLFLSLSLLLPPSILLPFGMRSVFPSFMLTFMIGEMRHGVLTSLQAPQ